MVIGLYLQHLNGRLKGQRIQLDDLTAEEITIGREEPCDIITEPEFKSVSARHATLNKTAQGWAITDVGSPHAEAIFASAAHYGVRRLKLGYWRYEPFGTLVKQLGATRRKLDGLVKLGRRYRVLPCIHVHSGRIIASGGAFVWMLVKDLRPDEIGAYVDPMHMTVEGGIAGWEMGLDLLAPWVALVGVKNFRWVENGRDARGQLRFRTMYTPLADGQAPLPEFVARLKEIEYDGVVSLHSEYKGAGKAFRDLSTPELLEQSAADLRYFRSLVAEKGKRA